MIFNNFILSPDQMLKPIMIYSWCVFPAWYLLKFKMLHICTHVHVLPDCRCVFSVRTNGSYTYTSKTEYVSQAQFEIEISGRHIC